MDQSLSAEEFRETLMAQVENLFGHSGRAKVSATSVKYLNTKTNLTILRTPRDHHQMTWAALTFITELKGRKVAITCAHVSGTIRKVQERACEMNTRALAELKILAEAYAVQSSGDIARNFDERARMDTDEINKLEW